jgi:cell wall-associated NlpC family hydrolase
MGGCLAKMGQHKSTPSPGDVVVFNWGAGPAHVTLFVEDYITVTGDALAEINRTV